jgi:hypothetical protein
MLQQRTDPDLGDDGEDQVLRGGLLEEDLDARTRLAPDRGGVLGSDEYVRQGIVD